MHLAPRTSHLAPRTSLPLYKLPETLIGIGELPFG